MKYSKFVFITTFVVTELLFSCTSPHDEISNKTWEGIILRRGDHKELSEVVLKMTPDSLFIYSNAIFGSDNDSLKLVNYNREDSVLTFSGLTGYLYEFKFELLQTDSTENLFLFGDDYAIVLARSSFDINSQFLDFYWNIPVPRDAFMYLDGTYSGDLEMENQFSDLLLNSFGGASVKLIFLEGFKVKIIFRSLLTDMFSSSSNPSYEIVDYQISGNRIILDSHNSKKRFIEVNDFGETLVLKTDELNVIMHKTY